MSKITDCFHCPSTRYAFPRVLIGALWLLAAAPMAFAADGADAAAPMPLVQDAYARAVPPGQPNSAAFMRIINPTAEALALVDASSSVARVVELHTHVQEDGMMKMRRVERIDVPAKGEVILQPGGLHLMLIGLTQPLAAGDPVDLRLSFDNGATLAVTAETRSIMGQMGMHGHRADQALPED